MLANKAGREAVHTPCHTRAARNLERVFNNHQSMTVVLISVPHLELGQSCVWLSLPLNLFIISSPVYFEKPSNVYSGTDKRGLIKQDSCDRQQRLRGQRRQTRRKALSEMDAVWCTMLNKLTETQHLSRASQICSFAVGLLIYCYSSVYLPVCLVIVSGKTELSTCDRRLPD